MSDQWTAQDQAQLDWVVKYGEPGARARPARITPRPAPVQSPPVQPGDIGILMMLTVVATLFVTIVIAQTWRWFS